MEEEPRDQWSMLYFRSETSERWSQIPLCMRAKLLFLSSSCRSNGRGVESEASNHWRMSCQVCQEILDVCAMPMMMIGKTAMIKQIGA